MVKNEEYFLRNKIGIFIFTKDRPAVLSHTINSIKLIPYSVFIIDDSVSLENRDENMELIIGLNQFRYLGQSEFDLFVNKYSIDFAKFSFLLRPLGTMEWNLGYARNFALMYAKSCHLGKVLFMDDDIEVINPKLIDNLFNLISDYSFVGANISGLVDDSILGHIATDLGIENERMLSGGFMVFNPNMVNQYFLNNYNEDWIWLFLQIKDKKHLQTGEVYQAITNPFSSYQKKIMFQEFGEIALDGILDLYANGSYSTLTLESFWERMLKERRDYLATLAYKSTQNEKTEFLELIEFIKTNFSVFNSRMFKNLFEEYFTNKSTFETLYNSLT